MIEWATERADYKSAAAVLQLTSLPFDHCIAINNARDVRSFGILYSYNESICACFCQNRSKLNRNCERIEGELSMESITLLVEIPADRHLVVDLPPETPLGEATLVLLPKNSNQQVDNTAYELARVKLLAAGALSTAHHVTGSLAAIPDDELLKMIQLPADTPSILDMINEDRGSY